MTEEMPKYTNEKERTENHSVFLNPSYCWKIYQDQT